jgi:predicted dehydrogenase
MIGNTVRFGVLGTGRIAAKFTEDLARSPGCEVVAVGSRTTDRAASFGHDHAIARAYGTYEDLVADPDVDIVYVAVPHPGHRDTAMLCLEAGKPVLVEKPFTMNLAQATEVIDTARARGLFCMEAMWTRFLPSFRHIRQLLDDGQLGELKTVVAEFGVWVAKDPKSRLFDPNLGGGALLDLGIYPVSLAHLAFGAPQQVQALSDSTFTGVDEQTSVLLHYEGGGQAILSATLGVELPNRAVIAGEDAYIEIERRWHQASSFTLTVRGGEPQLFEYPEEGNGLRYQAEEVAIRLRAGELESPVMPLDATLEVMATMDEIRAQIGLSYSGL